MSDALSLPAALLHDSRLRRAWSMLRLYWEVARRGYRRWAIYRAATLAGIFTNSVFGFMRAYVLIALFRFRPHAGGYSLGDALTYTWLTQGMLMTVFLWGWYEIAERVRSGDIVSDLHRPIDFQLYWLAQDLGRGAYHALFRGIPPFLVGMLFFSLWLPHHPLTYLAFAFSLALAICVSFALRFIINILAFWLMDYRGVGGLAGVIWGLLSGSIVPLTLFPPFWRNLTEALPFAGMVQTPVDIFLEKHQHLDLLAALATQAGWAIVLLLLGRWLLPRALGKLVVQGG